MPLFAQRRSSSASDFFGSDELWCEGAKLGVPTRHETSRRGKDGGSVRVQGLQASWRRTETGEASQGGM